MPPGIHRNSICGRLVDPAINHSHSRGWLNPSKWWNWDGFLLGPHWNGSPRNRGDTWYRSQFTQTDDRSKTIPTWTLEGHWFHFTHCTQIPCGKAREEKQGCNNWAKVRIVRILSRLFYPSVTRLQWIGVKLSTSPNEWLYKGMLTINIGLINRN